MSRRKRELPLPTAASFTSLWWIRRDLLELLERHFPSHAPGLRILDVGCGQQPYRARFGSGRVVGINISALDARPEVVADGLRMPFRDGTFDAALCTQVTEHVRDPFRLAGEIGRTLKPGGLALITGPMYWPLHEEPHDYWRFTRHGFSELARRAGLEVVDLRHDGHAASVLATAFGQYFRGALFSPLRLAVNLLSLAADRFVPARHSTTNLAMVVRRPAQV